MDRGAVINWEMAVPFLSFSPVSMMQGTNTYLHPTRSYSVLQFSLHNKIRSEEFDVSRLTFPRIPVPSPDNEHEP